jgi:hypothetical protein
MSDTFTETPDTTVLMNPGDCLLPQVSQELAAAVCDIAGTADLEPAVARERIQRLEAELAKLPQVDPPVRHFFVDGLYAREMFIPAGTCLVGKIHKHEHLCTVLGDISVLDADGSRKRIQHGDVFVSRAGAKRAGFAHVDTWWTTYHSNPSNTRDLAQLEAELIVPSFEALARTGLEQPEQETVQ